MLIEQISSDASMTYLNATLLQLPKEDCQTLVLVVMQFQWFCLSLAAVSVSTWYICIWNRLPIGTHCIFGLKIWRWLGWLAKFSTQDSWYGLMLFCLCGFCRVGVIRESLCIIGIQALAELNRWQEVVPFVTKVYNGIEDSPSKIIQAW